MRAPAVALLRAVLLGSVGLALAGCGGGASGSSSEPAGSEAPSATAAEAETDVRTRLAGQDVRLLLPSDGSAPQGLAVWFHGQGGDVDDRVDGPFFAALREDGWAVASSDFHAESWGNAASTQDTARLLAWAEDLAGTPASVWIAGSMGGSVSLNAMTHGVTPPACWYGVKPALELRKMQGVPGGPEFIDRAFGGPAPLDRVPVANLDDLPLDTRYRVVASPQDDWVPIDQNGGALAFGMDQRGAEVTYLPATGRHADPSHFIAPDIRTFAASCLDSAEQAEGAEEAGADESDRVAAP